MSSKTVNIHEAKTRLSELLALAMQGEEIIIAKANRPLVRLTPLEPPKKGRKAGLHEGIYWTSNDFDEPLPDDFFSNPLYEVAT
jgi:prevent-host-death family protein